MSVGHANKRLRNRGARRDRIVTARLKRTTGRDLATAQNNELQAVLAYRRSLVELERLQQTSLTTSNITILGGGR